MRNLNLKQIIETSLGLILERLTVQGGWFQGSPSICIGNCFLVLITTLEHCANLLPDDLRPVLTWVSQMLAEIVTGIPRHQTSGLVSVSVFKTCFVLF